MFHNVEGQDEWQGVGLPLNPFTEILTLASKFQASVKVTNTFTIIQ